MEPEDYCALIAPSTPQRVVESIPIASALGKVAAADVIAESPMPAFATSAMDGYALDASALSRAQAGERVSISGDVPAGSAPVAIDAGTAVRVMTGAQVPATAEVVVPVELTDASRTGEVPGSIRITDLPQAMRSGWNIKAVGEDTEPGDTLIRAGEKLTAAGVGTLAMLGRRLVDVERPLKIGLIVTGDELRTDVPDSPDTAGPYIHNSNLPMLRSAISATGAAVVDRSCGDDPAAFLAILDELAPAVDLIITTGGISAGAFEVVRASLEAKHSTFMRLALRPGGPQGHGQYSGTPLLHFPGTPTGAFLSFHLFARSLLDNRPLAQRWRKAVYAGPVITGHRKAVSLIPGAFSVTGEIEAAQRSRLRDYSGADVVIRVPRGPHHIGPGDVIAVLDC